MVARIAGGAALAAVLLLAGLLASLRTGFAPVRDAVRRFNRSVTNPRQLRHAGGPGAWPSVVHHVGRRSGRSYRTPVGLLPTDEGFLVVLPYGSGADWVRNVLAAGGARVEHDGRSVPVHRPELAPVAVADPHVGPAARWVHRVAGVRDVLLLRAVDPA